MPNFSVFFFLLRHRDRSNYDDGRFPVGLLELRDGSELHDALRDSVLERGRRS
jgi:hypothetical protein